MLRFASLDSQHFVPSRDPRRPRESSGGSWVAFQALRYAYDDVGNITGLDNRAPFDGHDPEDARVGTTTQSFSYDALYQLTAARGTYRDSAAGEHRYELEVGYDPIGNVERKRQLSERWKNQGAPSEPGSALALDYVLDDQSYLYHYLYEGYQPHAPSAIVEHDPSEEREDGRDRPQPDDRQKKQFLEYDESGNQLYRERSNDFREIDWSSENQIRSVTQDAETISKSLYDGANTRRAHFQRTSNGAEQTAYLGQYVTVRDGEHVTLHVFAGAVRIASKRERGDGGGSVSPLWLHPDHLGSTQYTSDDEQRLVTHAEYFPSGELWIDERSSEFRDAPVFLFNGKELEESTGLLAYGARHYDARQGQWLSPDPILDRYVGGEPNGGVFTPTNLGLYAYGANNPTSYLDTNGEFWGLAIKVGKVIVKGGDIASTVAGAVEDFQTVTDSNASTVDRILAAGSLAMEVFAVSPRDVKNVVGMVRGAPSGRGSSGGGLRNGAADGSGSGASSGSAGGNRSGHNGGPTFGGGDYENYSDLRFLEEIASRADRYGGATGTEKHTYAARMLRKYQGIMGQRRYLQVEQAYLDGSAVTHRKKGSAVPDVYDPLSGETFDYKFYEDGTPSRLRSRQRANNSKNLPNYGRQWPVGPR